MKIKLVLFDIYGTLAGFHPPREVIQKRAAGAFGLRLTDRGILQGYKVAERFLAEHNAHSPIRLMSDVQREQFWVEFERLVLQGDGHDVDYAVALKIWRAVLNQEYRLAPFTDVSPGLTLLRNNGLRTAAVSNMQEPGRVVISDLGFTHVLDFVLTSADAKVEKPHPKIFHAALQMAGVSAQEAIFVGDQIESDVRGAQRAEISPILIDRYNHYATYTDHPRVTSIPELAPIVVSGAIDSPFTEDNAT